MYNTLEAGVKYLVWKNISLKIYIFFYRSVIILVFNCNNNSGLVHLLSGIVMAEMVLDCWVGEELVTFIKVIKFLELAGSNLVAVTNLAICANLALIVHVSIQPYVCYVGVFTVVKGLLLSASGAGTKMSARHTINITSKYVS